MNLISNFRKHWDDLTINQKKELLDTIVHKMVFTDHDTPINLNLYFLGDIDVCSRTDIHAGLPTIEILASYEIRSYE